MPDPQQPAPTQPDPIECDPLILAIEKMLDVNDPPILFDQATLLHTYALRILVNLCQSMDVQVEGRIRDGQHPLAVRMAAMMVDKVGELKRYTYSNYDNLRKMEANAMKTLAGLKKDLSKRSPK